MALPGYSGRGPSPEEMIAVANGLRNWRPRSPYSSSPAQRAAMRGNSPGVSVMDRPTQQEAYANSTPFGRRVWNSANNGKVYDREWLVAQLQQNGGLGAPGAPSAEPTDPAASATPPPEGPPVPIEGPPEPPSAGTSMLENLDPAIIEQVMGLGDMERQMAFAEALRDRENPEGKSFWSKNGGQMYVAASPLEHGINAFAKFRGKRQADRIGKDQIAGRMRILDILKKQ